MSYWVELAKTMLQKKEFLTDHVNNIIGKLAKRDTRTWL